MTDFDADCFARARALGRLILTAEPARRLSHAVAALEAQPEDAAAQHDAAEARHVFRLFAEQVIGIVSAAVFGDEEGETPGRGCPYCPQSADDGGWINGGCPRATGDSGGLNGVCPHSGADSNRGSHNPCPKRNHSGGAHV